MQIFFTASLRGKAEYKQYYLRIIKSLVQDHQVFAEHVIGVDLADVKRWHKEFHYEYYQRIIHQIQRCDLMVAEMSTESINIGYELTLALQQRKQVIVLHNTSHEPDLLNHIDPDLISQHLLIVQYHKHNLEQKVDWAVAETSRFINHRLSINLPGYLVAFLDSLSYRGVTKSVFVRQLLDEAYRKGRVSTK